MFLLMYLTATTMNQRIMKMNDNQSLLKKRNKIQEEIKNLYKQLSRIEKVLTEREIAKCMTKKKSPSVKQ